MKDRPYFNTKIAEMESAFARKKCRSQTFDLMLHELSFRKSQRALELREKILASNNEHLGKNNNDRPSSCLNEPQYMNDDLENQNEDISTRPSSLSPKIFSKPPITNAPESILQAWIALEALSPHSYERESDLAVRDKSLVARFDTTDLPWEKGESPPQQKRLYFEVILGAIPLGPAMDSLLEIYADNRPDKPSMKGYCPVASILVDQNGRPLEERPGIAFTSFAWGLPIALQGDLRRLGDWPENEKGLITAFRQKLVRRNSDNELLPLTRYQIDELFQHAIDELDLSDHELISPYFALRRYEHEKSKTPPEPGLLNSFFMEDLTVACIQAKKNDLPHALRHYIGVEQPRRKTDLLRDHAGLRGLLQPALTPLGRWPSNGRFPLALLQQAAVNAATPAAMETGVLAVNGPPGTGKTTLLRDVVAARIVDRAVVMSSFNRPADALFPTSETLHRNSATITLHKLDERLKGFEMIVTSSNNKGVENVSGELPGLDAVADDAPNLRYFKTISDSVLGRETWGAIAAVLGKSRNRGEFAQWFWKDVEKGLSTYLNHASGVPQIVTEPQKGGPPRKRNRTIIDRENPPANEGQAIARWSKARTTFQRALKRSQDNQTKIQSIYDQLTRIISISTEVNKLGTRIPRLKDEVETLKTEYSVARDSLHAAEQELAENGRLKEAHWAARPPFWLRLLPTRRSKIWRAELENIEINTKRLTETRKNLDEELTVLYTKLREKQETLHKIQEKTDSLNEEKYSLKNNTSKLRGSLTAPVPDINFFAQDHEFVQTASVWFDKASQVIRDDVFESAIHLHRAFIDGAADPLRQNLSILVESFGTRSLGTAEKDALIADLWATFFLVVPVVSTTFASVQRMFSRLGPESLGWLLVDEAGQALPQAAVGAMMRTKRSVIVGDPLQIEPVVTLPNGLTEQICAYFGVDPLKYNAPEASVQTVADAASLYCARFPIGSGHRDVGAPLLVHRRCSSPMFDISNEIAYANLMVQAKKASPDNPILGPSAWINVLGNADHDKFSAEEARVLIDMLGALKARGSDPEIYIVTPFTIVQDNLRQAIHKSGVLDGWAEKPRDWASKHVGTVHTVQGRESDIVFFVLGAPLLSQRGARNWAGERPNLVNVAVTRAKASLYVIGNRELWKEAGVFAVLDRFLP